ncbi:SsgA family sporulation/cell division regulator [Streptomyces sp. NPDC059096]|uniref:SsgA family sporulation/cell division regulator n=1 Tax=Streptomyces sp. NPDC059096 TaxID=3346727 RepID=UPI00367DAF9E
MTVRKGEPMDHLTATDEEFDALLDASSLGAPHVVAATGDISAAARRRMAHAASRPPRSFGMPDDTSCLQAGGEADSRPAEPTDTEPPTQEVQPASRRILLVPMGAGKRTLLAALYTYRHSASFGPSISSRRQPLARQSWMIPSTADLLRGTWWSASGSDEAVRTGTVQRNIPRGDGMLTFVRHQDAQPRSDTLISVLRNPDGETPAIFSFTDARRQVVQLLTPDIQPPTLTPDLFGWTWAKRKQQRLRNLRDVIGPWTHPTQSLFSTTPAGLLVPPAPAPHLHIARFTTCAYTAVSGGLLVPKTADAPQPRRCARDSSRADRYRRQLADAGKVTLRQALVDGVCEVSAELPMLLHTEEHEPLALTTSLHTRLTYRVSDPYAVEARFRTDDQDETVWVFARDLLRDGLERKSGLGDVAVWPDAGKHGRPRVFVRLSSPEGSALLSAAHADVRVFLEAGSDLVAYGAEHAHLLTALSALETTIGELARPGRCD